MSLDYGEAILDPFKGSAVEKNTSEKFYDFDYLASDDEEILNIASDDQPFDDIIDLTGNLDN